MFCPSQVVTVKKKKLDSFSCLFVRQVKWSLQPKQNRFGGGGFMTPLRPAVVCLLKNTALNSHWGLNKGAAAANSVLKHSGANIW